MMGRAQDFDDLFDAEEAARRRADRAAMVERNEERSRVESEAEAKRAAEAARGMREANRRALLAEYQRAGVAPLSVDGEGSPRCSLALLLQQGWTIEEVYGKKTLVRPPRADPPPIREREQS